MRGSGAGLTIRRVSGPRFLSLLLILLAASAGAQDLPPGERVFHTFSIAAVDPATGESGVAVTTRNPCVGNGVPWVRAGVGAVATQARTRTEYGRELLDLLADGLPPEEALAARLAEDDGAAFRQIGVVALAGGAAQHTGSEASGWAGHRAGSDYAAQGNVLVGPEVVEAVAEDFEATRGSGRALADRLVSALEAGQAAGGDLRRGRRQSAAVMVADPRDGGSRREDRISTNLQVCEHPTPVAELRRVHDAVAGVLGYRTLQMFAGNDVAQLRILIEEAGCAGRAWRAEIEGARARELRVFDARLAEAVDACRSGLGLSTPDRGGSPPGLADREFVEALWAQLEGQGRAAEVRARLAPLVRITR